MEFALRKGMKNEEFLDTVRGRIAGESRARVQQILQTTEQELSHGKDQLGKIRPLYLDEQERLNKFKSQQELINQISNDFEVIDVNTELQMALVARRKVIMEPFQIFNENFLMGMDKDTQNYFLHPLYGWDFKEGISVEKAYEWSDRIDQGFTHSDRIQGDLFVKLQEITDYKTMGNHWYSTTKHTYYLQFGRKYHMFKLTSRYLYLNSSSTYMGEDKSEILIENKPSQLFANHRLECDGQMFRWDITPSNGIKYPTYFLINASHLVIKHAEHPTYSQVIPRDYVAIITAQRGQDNYYEAKQILS